MQLGRSPSGVLVLGAAPRHRLFYGAFLVFLLVLLGGQAWVWFAEAEEIPLLQLGVAALVLVFLFLLFGGLHAVRVALGERYSFDHRRRTVQRNGRHLCRYDEVEELRIVVWTRRHEMREFRLQLRLRGTRTAWLGGMVGEAQHEELNHVAHALAAELGVAVQVVH